MTATRPRFDNVISTGHVLQGVVLTFSLLGFVWYQSAWQAKTDARAETHHLIIMALEKNVTALVQSQAIQDERISTMAAAIIEDRRAKIDVYQTFAQIREELASIKAQLQWREIKRGG